MKLLRYKGRHIVVTELDDDITELPDTVKVVKRVALDASVEGVARRGRPPAFDKAVKSEDLEILDHGSLDPQVLADAQAALDELSAPVATVAAADEEVDAPDAPVFDLDDSDTEVVPMDAE